VGYAGRVDGPDLLELYLCVPEVVEETSTVAEHHGNDVELKFVQQSRCEAAQVGHEHTIADGRRRILLIAGEVVSGDALSEQLESQSPRPVLDVVAPVLQSRTHFVTTDIDQETNAARQRLAQTLRWAAEHEIDATGVIGDPIAPLRRDRG
jgi:hypothetical protein